MKVKFKKIHFCWENAGCQSIVGIFYRYEHT